MERWLSNLVGPVYGIVDVSLDPMHGIADMFFDTPPTAVVMTSALGRRDRGRSAVAPVKGGAR